MKLFLLANKHQQPDNLPVHSQPYNKDKINHSSTCYSPQATLGMAKISATQTRSSLLWLPLLPSKLLLSSLLLSSLLLLPLLMLTSQSAVADAVMIDELSCATSLDVADVPSKEKTGQTAINHSATSQSSQSSSSSPCFRHQYRLDNGLKVIIKEDHRSPVVMTQLWYKVGSSDEPDDKGGISHLLEHMMFKGTSNVSSDAFEKLIAKYGGHNNAFTSYDYTGYYEMFPANRYALALELEADRMKNLRFDAQDFAKERQVVMEERRQRTDDNPISKAYEAFRLLAMPKSPKGESVIGPMAEIESITLDDLKSWYHTWYAPNNATLVIVGDVDPDKVMAQVTRYFAHIQPSDLPVRPRLRQAGFRGYQRHQTTQAVTVPSLMMGFNVPSVITAQQRHLYGQPHGSISASYALTLLSDVLDGGLSARLESHLVREQGVLASVGTSYNLFDRGDGVFMIQATPREGVSLEQAEQAILREIDKLKVQPIEQQELDRAKTSTKVGLIYAQDSMEGQARMIGSLQTIGIDDRLLDTLPNKLDNYDTVTLQKIARQYLQRDNLTVLQILPENTQAKSEQSKESEDSVSVKDSK